MDEMVDRVVRALSRAGKLGNTYIVFTSDNGYLMGEHRREGKSIPHEGSIKVPFIVRGPGVPADAVRNEMVANVDWAPTIAGWAGVEPGRPVDGRQIGKLFSADPPAWRQRLLLAYFQHSLVHEEYFALRTADDRMYAEYDTGEKEYYDLAQDYYQLDNAYPTMDPALRETLSAQLALMKDCAGEACRTAESSP